MAPDVIFVSAGMYSPKKQDHAIARAHKYLNYGLLGLATIVSKHGYQCKVVHGLFDPPEEVARRIVNLYVIDDSVPMLVSIPSCFAISWATAFVRSITARFPKLRIVVGGRWVVGAGVDWLRSKMPEVSAIIGGTCEGRILDIVSQGSKVACGGSSELGSSMTSFGPILDYSLLERAAEFQPSIEVSRGCGMGCSFCAERDAPLTLLRSPEDVVHSVEDIIAVVNRTDIRPYLESSFFRPTNQWALELAQVQNQRGVSFQWRSESRVDSFSEVTLDSLAAAGLKVLDVGLESASLAQISRMKKSPRPDVYLNRASRLIQHCSDLGIWVKVNILLYPGETRDSIEETTSWLLDRKSFIKGVSVNPLLFYKTEEGGVEFKREIESLGGSLESESYLEELGYSFVNLSQAISAGAAKGLCVEIARKFMTAKDYFDLKSFSYLDPKLTYEEFMNLTNECDRDSLPFDF